MADITLSGVGKTFGSTPVLRDVSLAVADGEFVSLVGPSGCGKSTLLRIVAGLEGVSEGSVRIGDADVTAVRAADRDVAMVFQNYALYPHLTVAANLAVPLTMRRLTPWMRLPLVGRLVPGRAARMAEIRAETERTAEALGIAHLMARKPAQLSGGQRQRVALGRAIVRHPQVFLMDEPLSNLDAALRVQTRAEIVALHRRVGAATLYVTHDQSEAMTMSDRVAVMMDGRLLQVAAPEELYLDPADLRVAAFIGSPKINALAATAGDDGRVCIDGAPTGLVTGARGPVTFAVRPEALVPAARGLPARVRHVEFLGDCVLLHLDVPASADPVVCRQPPDGRPRVAVGEMVRLAADPSRAFVFDPAGRRVAAHVASVDREAAVG
jgi:multiple sugar transport system ATP-binding protein